VALTFGDRIVEFEYRIFGSFDRSYLDKYWLKLFDSTKTNCGLIVVVDK
jgi:hypothetical protein